MRENDRDEANGGRGPFTGREVLRAGGVIAEADYLRARQLVVRVVQMLSRLERRMV